MGRQPGLRTVEGVLTSALATVVREPVRLIVAGRTDAGVHAAAQVAHLDVSPEAWAALPGRSERRPEAALLIRVAGVLAREARRAWRARRAGPATSSSPGRAPCRRSSTPASAP